VIYAMELRVRLFGQFAVELGSDTILFDGVSNLYQLESTLKSRHVIFSTIPFKIAVNHCLTSGNVDFHSDDEIAVMPPFSGG
jgi:molybdopterin converting factor small subunit